MKKREKALREVREDERTRSIKRQEGEREENTVRGERRRRERDL